MASRCSGLNTTHLPQIPITSSASILHTATHRVSMLDALRPPSEVCAGGRGAGAGSALEIFLGLGSTAVGLAVVAAVRPRAVAAAAA